MKKFLAIVILIFPAIVFASFSDWVSFFESISPQDFVKEQNIGGGLGTIEQLDQWKATTTPYSAVTTNVFGKNIYLPFSHATTSYFTVLNDLFVNGSASFNSLSITNASTTNLTVSNNSWLGTILSGIWNGSSISDTYIDDNITASNYLSLSSWFATTTIPHITHALGLTNASSTQLTTTGNTWLSTLTGNVGIGTTSPFQKLSVEGDIWVHNGTINVDYLANNGASNIANQLVRLARVSQVGGITKGQPVYQVGATGDKPTVALAYNTAHSPTHAIGIAKTSGANGDLILVQVQGELRDVDTSSYTEGCWLNLTAVAGVMECWNEGTTGAHSLLGRVSKVNVNSGIIEVQVGNYQHSIRGVSDIDLELGVGANTSTNFIRFEDLAHNALGWISGIGEFMWGEATTTSPIGSLFTISTTSVTNLFRVNDNGNGDTSPFIIDATGRVGVGTTTPYEELSVVGDVVGTLTGTFGNVVIPTVFTDTTDPSGFIDRNNVISFATSTRTFTISGNHYIYENGVKYLKTSTSTTLTDTTGLYWVYYDQDGIIQNSTTFPTWAYPVIATVYWNTTIDDAIIGNERHGIKMSVDTHTYNHDTVGTRYDSLTGGLTGTFGNSTLSITAGGIYDEDVRNSIPLSTTNYVLYKNGSADFEFATTTTPYKTVAGALQYNNGNALANVDVSKYTCEWVFASNATTTPIITIIGQRQDLTLQNARDNCTYESLSFGTLPVKEMKILYRVIYQNVAGTPTYVETQDLRALTNQPAGTFIATQHSVLSGLSYSLSGHTGFAGLDVDNTFTGLNIFGNASSSLFTVHNKLWTSYFEATSTTATSTLAYDLDLNNLQLTNGGYIWGDTINPFIRLNSSAGTFIGYDGTHSVYTTGVIQSIIGGNEFARMNSTGFGIGTTSPFRKLSVVGSGWFDDNVTASTFTATSTTATSTLPNLSVTGAVSILGEYFTNFTTYVRSLFTAGTGIAISSGQISVLDNYLFNNGDTGTGTYDFSGATLKQHQYATFTYPTSTAWTGTTTIPLGVAYTAEQWEGVKCFTDTGTLNVSFYDGTNRMNLFNASTTAGTVTLSTNNTFTASEKRYVDIGTPATSPTKISCTVDRIINN